MDTSSPLSPPPSGWGAAAPAPDAAQFGNTTPLQVGQRARIDGRDYTVLTRVVLGIAEQGATRYRNVFQLVSADAACVYLVEDAGRWQLQWVLDGVAWRPGADAVPGAVAPFGRVAARITTRAVITTCHIEGTGDACFPALHASAEYLDAQAGDRYSAVWAGDRYAFYQGRPVALPELQGWFGLTAPTTPLDTLTTVASTVGWVIRVVKGIFMGACVLLILFLFALSTCQRNTGSHQGPPPVVLPTGGSH